MAGSVNKVILLGHLGKDPQIRSFQDGGKMATFSIATSESWKDRNTGEKKERTEWHNVVINGPLTEVVERYMRKGSKVYIEGQLRTRKWQDQSGNDRYSTEVVISGRGQLVLLDGSGGKDKDDKASGGSNSNDGWGASDGGKSGGGGWKQGDTSGRWNDDLDDDIPF